MSDTCSMISLLATFIHYVLFFHTAAQSFCAKITGSDENNMVINGNSGGKHCSPTAACFVG